MIVVGFYVGILYVNVDVVSASCVSVFFKLIVCDVFDLLCVNDEEFMVKSIVSFNMCE